MFSIFAAPINPIYFDLIGQFIYFDIDERC